MRHIYLCSCTCRDVLSAVMFSDENFWLAETSSSFYTTFVNPVQFIDPINIFYGSIPCCLKLGHETKNTQ